VNDPATQWSAAPAVAPMYPCQICGRGPTTIISLSRGLGMIFLRRVWTYRAPLCRDHGTAIARNWLVATALMGWWGIVSFFLNWVSIAQDFNAWRVARRLAPAGSVVVPGSFGFAPPATSPHVPRIQLAAFAVLILALVGFGVWSATYGSKSVRDFGVGDCFNEPPGLATASEISEMTSRPCNEPHDGEVFAILSYPESASAFYPADDQILSEAESQCEPVALTYLGNDTGLAQTLNLYFLSPTADGWSHGDRRLVCYFESATGGGLTRSVHTGS
jgi:putative regulator of septum formation